MVQTFSQSCEYPCVLTRVMNNDTGVDGVCVCALPYLGFPFKNEVWE